MAELIESGHRVKAAKQHKTKKYYRAVALFTSVSSRGSARAFLKKHFSDVSNYLWMNRQ